MALGRIIKRLIVKESEMQQTDFVFNAVYRGCIQGG